MKFGDKSDHVKSMQKALNAVGYPVTIDGEFGTETELAVKLLQEKNGLVADGVVGPKTLQKFDQLEAAIAKKSSGNTSAGIPGSSSSSGSLVKGVDVYHGDDPIDWVKVKMAGYSFAFLKATEGVKFRDPSFQRNWEQTKKNGIIRGAYHFFRSNLDGMSQAQNLLNSIGQLQLGDLPVVCDFETMDGVDATAALGRLKVFMDRVKIVTKKTPILYTMRDQVVKCGHAAELAQYPLWLAAPGHTLANVKVPAPWTSLTFLQDSFKTGVPGVHKAGDSDVFNGTYEDLQAYANQVR